jgi:ligand-binding sensor domain-containing protein
VGGYLWVATDKGVSRFDGSNWISYSSKDGLPDNQIYSIGLDLLGNIWIGSLNYAGYYDGKKWNTAFIHDSDQDYWIISSISPGPDGSVWFGTGDLFSDSKESGNGVIRYKDGKISIYRTSDGLASDIVNSIVVGPDGAMWFGTEEGVSRFDWMNNSN